MKIEIVTHCWRYWRCLTYQALTLVNRPPTDDIEVVLHVFAGKGDEATKQRIQELKSVKWPQNTHLLATYLTRRRLFRRAIGRNMAALNTTADVVWFTDCDFLIHGSTLNDLAMVFRCTEASFVHPARMIGTTFEKGGELIQSASHWPFIYSVDRCDFNVPQNIPRAIGATQILSGDLCREMGYLKGFRRWQSPRKRWGKTCDDVAFRKHLSRSGIRAKRIQLRDVLRVRHATKGHFVSNAEL